MLASLRSADSGQIGRMPPSGLERWHCKVATTRPLNAGEHSSLIMRRTSSLSCFNQSLSFTSGSSSSLVHPSWGRGARHPLHNRFFHECCIQTRESYPCCGKRGCAVVHSCPSMEGGQRSTERLTFEPTAPICSWSMIFFPTLFRRVSSMLSSMLSWMLSWMKLKLLLHM